MKPNAHKNKHNVNLKMKPNAHKNYIKCTWSIPSRMMVMMRWLSNATFREWPSSIAFKACLDRLRIRQ